MIFDSGGGLPHGKWEHLKMHFLQQELVISTATCRFKSPPPSNVRRTTWAMVAVCCGKMVAWNW